MLHFVECSRRPPLPTLRAGLAYSREVCASRKLACAERLPSFASAQGLVDFFPKKLVSPAQITEQRRCVA